MRFFVLCMLFRELELARMRPAFDLDFAKHSRLARGQLFLVDEAQGTPAASVSGAMSILMHQQPSGNVVRPAGIHGPV